MHQTKESNVWKRLAALGWIRIISSWNAEKQETRFYDGAGNVTKTVPAGPNEWSLEDVLDLAPAIDGDTLFQLDLGDAVKDARWLRISKGGILRFYDAKGDLICAYTGLDFIEGLA